jgi:hypothetical protein
MLKFQTSANEAYKTCCDLGMQLAIIENKQELDCLGDAFNGRFIIIIL